MSAPKSTGYGITRHNPLRDSLISKVLGANYASPRVIRPKKVKARPPGKGIDEMVLEVRRLREQEAMMPVQIMAHMAELGHPLSLDRIHQLIAYNTRSHLVPTPGAKPYITKAAP